MIYWLIGIGLLICICLSALFSGSEIVFASVNKLRLKRLMTEGDKRASRAYGVTESFTESISTILVGNNLVNIAATSMATVLAIRIFGADKGPTMATLCMTLLILTFGEILPKTIAIHYSTPLSLRLAMFIDVCKKVFKPIIWVVTKMTNRMAKLWTPLETEPTSDEELLSMVETIEEEGVIDEKQGELLRSAIEFCDIDAYEIMVPRVDVVAFDVEDDIETLFEDGSIYAYSRIPVFEESIDNIIGVLPTKKILRDRLCNRESDIRAYLTQPLYVHKTKEVSALLKEFRTHKTHIAIVLDEFGGTLGILTMEDVLEELVGDIWDETDEIEEEFVEKGNGEYIIDGDMNIYDMFDLTEVSDKDFDSDYTTVGGWATDILGRFPEVGDSFDYKNLTVTILEVEPHRVLSLKVIKHTQTDEAST